MAKKKAARAGRRTSGPWEPRATDLDIYRRWCEGERQDDIAPHFSITRSGVSRILKKVERFLAQRYIDDIRGLKLRQTVRLEKFIREMEAAWERSKLDAVVITEKDVEIGESKVEGTETSKRTSGQCGNPTYIETAMGAMDRVRKMWGADAPVEHHHSGEIRVAGMDRAEAREAFLTDQLRRVQEARVKQLEPQPN